MLFVNCLLLFVCLLFLFVVVHFVCCTVVCGLLLVVCCLMIICKVLVFVDNGPRDSCQNGQPFFLSIVRCLYSQAPRNIIYIYMPFVGFSCFTSFPILDATQLCLSCPCTHAGC